MRALRLRATLALSLLALASNPSGSLGREAPSDGIAQNLGQLPEEVSFHARSGDADLFFTETAIVLDLTEAGHAIWLHLGSESAGPEPLGLRITKLNYLKGSDPRQWVTEVPVYDELVYPNIRPGIDLYLRPESGTLRYEFRTGDRRIPATSPFRFEGARPAEAGAGGEIRIETPTRTVWDEPVGWDPAARRIRWRTENEDPHEPDLGRGSAGSLSYSSYLGGWGHDRAHALDVLGNDEIVMGGYSQSTNFPTNPGSYQPENQGGYDACVCRFASDSATLLWATFLGGDMEDRVFAVHEDRSGNLVLGGHTYSADFPTTEGAFDRTFGELRDAYCAKVDPTGSTLLFSTYLGGSETDRAWDLGLDSEDRPILCGDTSSPDFPVTDGAYDTEIYGEFFSDGFLIKLEADGSDVVWGTYLGGQYNDNNKFMAVFPDDSPVVTGTTISPDFPTTAGAWDETYNTGQDAIVAKFSPDGSSLVYSTFVGGFSSDLGEAIAITPSGDVVVTGATSSVNFPIAGDAYDSTHNGMKDAYVFRLDATGTSLVFSTFIGGDEDDEPWALTLGPNSEPIFSGYVNSANFPTTPDGFDLTHNGGTQDANLTVLDPFGSSLTYSSYLGGNSLDGGWELDLDNQGQPVLVGPTGSGDFPTTADAYDRTHNGGRDMFLARFSVIEPSSAEGEPDPVTSPRIQVDPNPFTSGTRIRFDLPDGPSDAELLLVDAGGRRVTRLTPRITRLGIQSVWWDGTDDRGGKVPAGTYWVTLKTDTSFERSRITILR